MWENRNTLHIKNEKGDVPVRESSSFRVIGITKMADKYKMLFERKQTLQVYNLDLLSSPKPSLIIFNTRIFRLFTLTSTLEITCTARDYSTKLLGIRPLGCRL